MYRFSTNQNKLLLSVIAAYIYNIHFLVEVRHVANAGRHLFKQPRGFDDLTQPAYRREKRANPSPKQKNF